VAALEHHLGLSSEEALQRLRRAGLSRESGSSSEEMTGLIGFGGQVGHAAHKDRVRVGSGLSVAPEEERAMAPSGE
jgi:hypothetical protein